MPRVRGAGVLGQHLSDPLGFFLRTERVSSDCCYITNRPNSQWCEQPFGDTGRFCGVGFRTGYSAAGCVFAAQFLDLIWEAVTSQRLES